MTDKTPTKRNETSETVPEGKERNSLWSGNGAFNVTTAKDTPSPNQDQLMEQVVERGNMNLALRQVEKNKRAPGIDGMTTERLRPYLHEHWPRLKEALLSGVYKPNPVRAVEIPKPGQKGMRTLGIPTVVDRLIQQAIHQVLSPLFDKDFSRKSGERVLKSITGFLEHKLKLKVNQDKTKVDRPARRKFLGYSMTMNLEPLLKVAPESWKRLKGNLKEVFRKGRGHNLGRLIKEELNPILRGWGNYFKLNQTKIAFEEADSWIRHRLRCVIWRQAKRFQARKKKLMLRGLAEERACLSAGNGRGPWWNSGASHMNEAYPRRYFDSLGLISLLDELRRIQVTT